MRRKPPAKRLAIIDRPLEIQKATRQLWSPSIVRTRFILQEELDLFNEFFAELPISPVHKLDKIVLDTRRDFFESWVKGRFTCLGNDWHVGTILLKERTITFGTWWFQNTSRCMPDASYNPNVIPYKLILIPLQVNHREDSEEYAKINYYTTNYHYVKNNISVFKHIEDRYKSSKSKFNQSNNFDLLEKADTTLSLPEWYKKYEFTKYTNRMDRLYLQENWDIEMPYTWIPGSALIIDATRIYGYPDKIKGINHRRLLSIMTYKTLL